MYPLQQPNKYNAKMDNHEWLHTLCRLTHHAEEQIQESRSSTDNALCAFDLILVLNSLATTPSKSASKNLRDISPVPVLTKHIKQENENWSSDASGKHRGCEEEKVVKENKNKEKIQGNPETKVEHKI
ncbi:hypothetical protein L798_05806 [Zootermopsis nevadensis]|uniref:Uncharacterized protein n=1 Tax=Zootermopsis nevadensis TaxID=136037 RepID=A0A067RI10_ZOONE|nr:hypothetical protein L798_05806 [Zootermopsis nevadensis]